MNYTPLYLQQAMPIVSQHTHYVSNIDLVNDRVIELDMPRYYEYTEECRHVDAPHINTLYYGIDFAIYFALAYKHTNTINYYIQRGIDVTRHAVTLAYVSSLLLMYKNYKT